MCSILIAVTVSLVPVKELNYVLQFEAKRMVQDTGNEHKYKLSSFKQLFTGISVIPLKTYVKLWTNMCSMK
jgi:hypothetical protein